MLTVLEPHAMSSPLELYIDLSLQQLALLNGSEVIVTYSISSGKNGIGEKKGSGQTPRGWHKIRAKIGTNALLNTVFVGRRPTGEYYSPELAKQFPERDWILTRILWLSGLEKGKNRLGEVDTMQRYIYIHGSPDTAIMGVPGSKGCIRMHNHDIVELFNKVNVGTKVLIKE